MIELCREPRGLGAGPAGGRGHIERNHLDAAHQHRVVSVSLDVAEILQIIGNSLLKPSANLVVSDRGQLEALILSPGGSFIAKNLPVSVRPANVWHVAREQQDLGILFSHALGQPLANTWIGADLDRGIREAHITVSHHLNRRARRLPGDREGWIYVDLFGASCGSVEQERANGDESEEDMRAPLQGFSKWKMHGFRLTSCALRQRDREKESASMSRLNLFRTPAKE